jgi:2-polyprenyl-3-methyl-5-hydroxy-6-metoxy-1,4-benzoquinol methylase
VDPYSPLSRLLQRHVDPLLERVIHFGVRLELRDPVRVALAAHRRRARARVAAEVRPEIQAIEAAVVAREPAATRRYDALVGEAVERMRGAWAEEARGTLTGAIDRTLYQDRSELLDDPDFPVDQRAIALDGLHRLNEQLGVYEAFAGALGPLFSAAERIGSPVRLHDLASGHGGFALFLKQRYGDRARVEASDIKDEYLEIGRHRAADLGLEAAFFVEDALAIEGAKGADVITCTQAVHHFPPGMVARMIGEAARAARVGVCLIDAERSWLNYGFISVITAIYGRSYVLWHDGRASLRRMFYEEELGLFADLAPGLPPGAAVETGSMLPAHAFVRVTREPV